MLIFTAVFLPILAAFPVYLLGRNEKYSRIRDCLAFLTVAAVLAMVIVIAAHPVTASIANILCGSLTFTTDGFRCTYAVITAVMWLGTTLFSFEYFAHEREGLSRYWFFNLVTFGATMGVMLSGDFLTAFVFFEILSFTSFTWVIHEETKDAIHAGYTYLFIAVIGGLVLLMGLLLLQHTTGTLSFAALAAAAPAAENQGMLLAAAICILLGFGAKAGMFPLHIWLPKAHPIAPSPASALLSGILTKVGIYGILMTAMTVLPESEPFGLLVLSLGLITMFLGAVLAVFSVNLKRTLACSSMSQIGFILTGTAMFILLGSEHSEEGTALALSGLMLHMVNHSLIKLVLFMAAGVVVMNLHVLTLNEIRGWGRKKPLLKTAFAFGALGISGMPLFNGYISKTMLHESIVEGIHECASLSTILHAAEWIFLFSGGLTFAYMLKLFICIFVEKNADPARQALFDRTAGADTLNCSYVNANSRVNTHSYMNRLSAAAIFIPSLLMVILGQPSVMTSLAAYMTGNEEILAFKAFTPENLKGGLISLSIGALVYVLFIRKVTMRKESASSAMAGKTSYVNLWPDGLDLEQLIYRPLITGYLPHLLGKPARILGENVVLNPFCRAVMLFLKVLLHMLCDGTDFLILLLRKSIFREKHTDISSMKHAGKIRTIEESTLSTVFSLSGNFTFAMMMTCIGIIVILVVLIGLSL